MNFSIDDLRTEAERLQEIAAVLPGLKVAFLQAAQGNYEEGSVKAILHACGALKADTTVERLRRLSQERADGIGEEIEGSLAIAASSMDRVRILLRNRTPIYAEAQMQACKQDIFDHLGYSDPVFDPFTSRLSPEQRRGQVGLHLERAQGFTPSFQSFDQKNQTGRIDAIGQRLKSIRKDHAEVSRSIVPVSLGGPMSDEDVTDLYGPTPPGPEEVRSEFGRVSFDLGRQHIKISDAAFARIKNVICYMHLIDRELKPANIGDPSDWDNARENFRVESENSFGQLAGFIARSKVYLKQATFFAPDARP